MKSPIQDAQRMPSDRLAETFSAVFHPFIVVIPTMLITILFHGDSLGTALFWTILSIAIVLLPLTYLIYSGVRSGRYTDASISMREQRRSLYIAASLLFILLMAILWLGKAPVVLQACMAAAVLATVLGFVINARFTKLSLHSIAIAGCTTVMIFTIPWIGISMIVIMFLVAWARIRLRHHTPGQIFLGWTVAITSVVLVFHMFHLLSWST
jgi:hypothetical protein